MKYARQPQFAFCPPLRLTATSHASAITKAEVAEALDGLLDPGYTAQTSSVELTFDVRCRFAEVQACLFHHHAQRTWVYDANPGWQTEYFGSPKSAWQLRVYQKPDGVVRVEFVLRRPFLRRWALSSLSDLGSLRQFDLHRLVRFQEVDPQAFAQVISYRVRKISALRVRVRAALRLAREQPIYADVKFLFDSKENVCGRSNQTSFIFRELTLADPEPTCKLLLVDIESSDLPEPPPKGL